MDEIQITNLDSLKRALRVFAEERDWQQYHSPKNLAAALMVEAAELLEHFQWLTQEQSYTLSAEQLREVGHEMADVLIYLTRLADRLDIDLMEAVSGKIELNAQKYPPLSAQRDRNESA